LLATPQLSRPMASAGLQAPQRPDILDLLSDAATPSAQILIPFDSQARSVSDLWQLSLQRAEDLQSRYDEGETIAFFLSTSLESIATLIGAWMAGLDTVSLPEPPVDELAERYREQIGDIFRLVHPVALHAQTVPAALDETAWLPDRLRLSDSRVAPHRSARESSRSTGRFIQFTSGTTAGPKGVVLSTETIGACVNSTLEVIRPTAGSVSCSWLPLSHDMGLIGMCLAAIVGAGPGWAGNGKVVLIPPEVVIRTPSIFLRTCSDMRATITATSARGLELATRMLMRGDSYDLSSVRCWIVGGEIIHPRIVSEFCREAARSGMDPSVVSPSYGLAEAALTVTMTHPSSAWSLEQWSHPSWTPLTEPIELVSCGRPVAGVQVAIDAPGGGVAGEVVVSGPNLMNGYVGRPPPRGSLTTGDLGFMKRGELYVIGRLDDLVFVGDRQMLATAIEQRVTDRVEGVRRCAVVQSREDSQYELVIEPSRIGSNDVPNLARRAARQAHDETGTQPARVRVVSRRTIPYTHSGKLRRGEIGENLPTVFELTRNS
jgi:acyl-CoA synthetase (AMP-forming)/AMP-acid ligase II